MFITNILLPIKFDASMVSLNIFRQISGSQMMNKHVIMTVNTKGRKIDLDSMDEQVNLPTKPKKPAGPWIKFVQERKETFMRENPGAPISKITPLLAREWKMINQTKYQEEFEVQKENYKKCLQEYNNSLTDQQKKYLKLKKSLVRDHNGFKELKKTRPLPPLPRNPANIYSSERYKDPAIRELLSSEGSAKVSKIIFEEYRSLSDNEKAEYLKKQKEDKLRFKKEFDTWYQDICNDASLRLAVREQAEAYYQRLKSLNYI